MWELLESRRLLAASASLSDSGVLSVLGTDGDDVILIQSRGSASTGNSTVYVIELIVNGNRLGEFQPGKVSSLRVYGLGGDDTIALDSQFVSRELHPLLSGTRERQFAEFKIHVDGGAGNDSITGSDGRDTIVGGAGDDLIDGRGGSDMLSGGAGDDKLAGRDGHDRLIGGTGNDGLNGGGGNDAFAGGRGVDTADYSDRTDPIYAEIELLPFEAPAGVEYGPNGTLAIDGRVRDEPGAANTYELPTSENYFGTGSRRALGVGRERDAIDADTEVLVGGKGNDVLVGNQADNILVGGEGDDVLVGGLGLDTLYGSSGNDILLSADNRDGMPGFGGHRPGSDRVVGGTGLDLARCDLHDQRLGSERIDKLSFLWS